MKETNRERERERERERVSECGPDLTGKGASVAIPASC